MDKYKVIITKLDGPPVIADVELIPYDTFEHTLKRIIAECLIDDDLEILLAGAKSISFDTADFEEPVKPENNG